MKRNLILSICCAATISPLSSLGEAPSPGGSPQATQVQARWGTLIPCQLVNTVESSITTPVIGIVKSDIWQDKKLIIPAGTVVTCMLRPSAVRDRIEVAGKWVLTYPDGKQGEIEGMACDREEDGNGHFGIEDGSAGIPGTVVKDESGDAGFVRALGGKQFYLFTTHASS
jgi:type F conjugative transfer system protein TrbI